MTLAADAADRWTLRERLIAATLGVAAFLTQFDVTSVVVVMPAVGAELRIAAGGLGWIIDAYSLAFTASLLVAGGVADRFGRRRSLLGGAWCFLAASLGCALAPGGAGFLAARAVQGCGAAFLVTGAFASVAAAFPAPRARARAFGVVGAISGVAMALGPSLGGAIGSLAGWRWIFLVNVPFCALLLWAAPRVAPESRDGTGKALDWAGVLTLTAALGLAVDGLMRAHASTARMAAELAGGAVLLGLFARQQGGRQQGGRLQRGGRRPMLDPAVFASRRMAGLGALLLAVSVGYWAVLVYLPLFLMAAFGWTMGRAGLVMLAATLPMLLVPPLGARLLGRLGWWRLFAAGLAAMTAGGAALAAACLAADAGARLGCAVAGMAATGVGAALAHPQLSGAVVALAPPDEGGMASAVTVVARQAGFAVGVAGLGALVPPGSAAGGFAWMFGVAAAASAGGMLCSLLLRDARPNAA